jgi:hypothetical protein
MTVTEWHLANVSGRITQSRMMLTQMTHYRMTTEWYTSELFSKQWLSFKCHFGQWQQMTLSTIGVCRMTQTEMIFSRMTLSWMLKRLAFWKMITEWQWTEWQSTEWQSPEWQLKMRKFSEWYMSSGDSRNYNRMTISKWQWQNDT